MKYLEGLFLKLDLDPMFAQLPGAHVQFKDAETHETVRWAEVCHEGANQV